MPNTLGLGYVFYFIFFKKISVLFILNLFFPKPTFFNKNKEISEEQCSLLNSFTRAFFSVIVSHAVLDRKPCTFAL